jgi:hypothetical protein
MDGLSTKEFATKIILKLLTVTNYHTSVCTSSLFELRQTKSYITSTKRPHGRVREWLNRPVSKTGISPSGIEGSNPSPSANRRTASRRAISPSFLRHAKNRFVLSGFAEANRNPGAQDPVSQSDAIDAGNKRSSWPDILFRLFLFSLFPIFWIC